MTATPAKYFSELSGVFQVNDMGKAAELSLEPDADHQRVLQSLVGKLTIHQFSVKTPSLHEIFVPIHW